MNDLDNNDALTWEERMGARARVRRAEESERESVEHAAAEREALVATRRAFLEQNPTPPGGCFECYELAEHPSFGSLHWWHVWPDDQPLEDWVCRHECHGPDGSVQHALLFG